MSWLLLAVAMGATCEHPALALLPEARQEAACALLAQPNPQALDRLALAPIYERPGFERARQRNDGAFQALVAQLLHWFETLFESTGAETYSNVTRVLVLVLALLIGAGVTWRFLARRRARSIAPAPAHHATPLELDEPGAHLARADALLGTSPREAIREGLLALLSSLERRRFARPDRVKTNRELAQELAARGAPPQLVGAVTPLFDWYDTAFYSLDPVAPEQARQFVADVRGLQERTR